MARKKTDARKVFDKNIQRTRAFLRLFDEDRAPGQPSKDERQLLYGTVIFAVGALDAYLHDLVLEIVVGFGCRNQEVRQALKEIAKKDPGLALRLHLADSEDSRTEEFQIALGEFLDQRSFQGPGKVEQAVAYIGRKLDWEVLDGKRRPGSTKGELKELTDLRHRLVHRSADQAIKRCDAEHAVELVDAIAHEIDRGAIKSYNEPS